MLLNHKPQNYKYKTQTHRTQTHKIRQNRTKKQKRQSYYLGIIAEFIAIIFLTFKGYRILHRRYKSFAGEVDIIAKKGGYLVAIEVKARRKWTPFLVEEVLSDFQKGRIKRSMEFFWSKAQNQFSNCGVRFDLIIVTPYKLPQHMVEFW
ncbi:MAG: YraN family protein [Proteobacteria bacterium]|nr:YraN family protein [Pseudomonadota bacterium]